MQKCAQLSPAPGINIFKYVPVCIIPSLSTLYMAVHNITAFTENLVRRDQPTLFFYLARNRLDTGRLEFVLYVLPSSYSSSPSWQNTTEQLFVAYKTGSLSLRREVGIKNFTCEATSTSIPREAGFQLQQNNRFPEINGPITLCILAGTYLYLALPTCLNGRSKGNRQM
jgi:hypothetical protein